MGTKMTQTITVTKVEDHHEMTFCDGGDSYPVPTNAIEKLDDDLTPEEAGESVTFRGDYGGHKHAKTFDVEEVVDGLDGDEEPEADEAGTGTDTKDEDETIDVDELEPGDRVENPGQCPNKEFEVVDVREKRTFDGTETVFAVRQVGRRGDLTGPEDVIYERDHDRWQRVEAICA